MPNDYTIPGTHRKDFRFAAAMTGATANDEFVLWRIPPTIEGVATGITITGGVWIPDAAVTANGTNFSVLSVRNRGAADAGTALPLTRSYAATNSVARIAEAMTPDGTAANLLCAAGDVLTVQRIATASGLVLPAGLLIVQYTLR